MKSAYVFEWEYQVSRLIGQPYTLTPEHRGLLRAVCKRCGLSPPDMARFVTWGFLCGAVTIYTNPIAMEHMAERWQAYEEEVKDVGADIGQILYEADREEQRNPY